MCGVISISLPPDIQAGVPGQSNPGFQSSPGRGSQAVHANQDSQALVAGPFP